GRSQAVLVLRRRAALQHPGQLAALFSRVGSRALSHGLALACSEARQAAPRLELRLDACLLMAGHVPAGAVKLGNLAEPLRATPRQATLDSLQLRVTGYRARVLQLPLAAEHSSGFQS